MNQFGGIEAECELGEWTAGDKNNPLMFVAEKASLTLMPTVSSEDDIVFLLIR